MCFYEAALIRKYLIYVFVCELRIIRIIKSSMYIQYITFLRIKLVCDGGEAAVYFIGLAISLFH